MPPEEQIGKEDCKNCFLCKSPAVEVTAKDLFFGCKKHLQKAKDKTLKNLAIISKIGFKKWLETAII